MLRKALILVTIFLSILLMSMSLSSIVNPGTTVFLSIISGLFPMYIVGCIIMIFYWLLTKKIWFILPLIALFVGQSSVNKHFGTNCWGGDEVGTDLIRVGTFNVFGLKKIKKSKDNEMNQHLIDEVMKVNLDIICFQENNPYSSTKIQTLVGDQFPYSYSYAGIKLLTKFEILDKGTFNFDSQVNGCLWSDLKIKDRKIRVYCTHFKSNMVSEKADEIMQDVDITERKTWLGLREMMSRYKRASLVRTEQARRVKAHANRSPNPILICGDFNDHPLSYVSGELCRGLKDSFIEKGCGWGTTYGGSMPLLRIDYILADSTFSIEDHDIRRSKISDHHLVTSTLSFAK